MTAITAAALIHSYHFDNAWRGLGEALCFGISYRTFDLNPSVAGNADLQGELRHIRKQAFLKQIILDSYVCG